MIALADAEEREQRLYQENRENNNPSYVHYDNEIWLRTPVPQGSLDPPHVADHGSAERQDPPR